MKRAWFEAFTWTVIVETNRQLCLPKGALHKATSDGYEPTRQLWESRHHTDMTLAEATDLCRRCHQLTPFCNFNGNTFVAVIRRVITSLNSHPTKPPLCAASLVTSSLAPPRRCNGGVVRRG
ncbi:MAG: hypothetical protein KJ072_26645 [Verrucomicrobia bacterium]|nr:hypothetical protein [Verrucomicrobiota bacterium]